ncbi:DUF6900 domain-containing protein [Mucisphaera calidilacus]|uniref:DUF6900 domain-containing protein n=1 Tax=Mucisphaera calidilacus TaxID=2527982 RepID=A0A518BVN8_9BACT|nr:hypothetical protein [Mucisphaera calidilacus]QDU71053.1 hypothetical protein Pan265_08980 [Mucisphaera calidilacus]
MPQPRATTDQALHRIASETLGLETLETRKSDSLDFHEVSVWGVKAALEQAYEAGRKAAPPQPPTRTICPACGREIETRPL